MKKTLCFPIRSSGALLFPLLLVQFIALPLVLVAQDGDADATETESTLAPSKSALTVADPAIKEDYLGLLVLPLTRDELLNEANAWRGLLKEKQQVISQAEIKTRLAHAEASPDKATALPSAGPATDPATEVSEEERDAAINSLVTLREEKAALIDRLSLVVDAYEEKGGDGKEMRDYILAVTGIQVDVTDRKAFRAAIEGWLTAEDGGRLVARKAAIFIAILLVFKLLSSFVGRLVRKAVERQASFSDLLKKFINTMVRRAILFVGLLVAISSLGVNVSALFALIGGGAFVVGFALQDTLSNFAAGIMVLIYRPFDVGDVVSVGGVDGTVGGVSLVSTTIRTFDNKSVLVPNKSVWGQVITNSSANDERRVDLVFSIGYEDDIDKAQQILERLVAEHELILDNPEPVITVHELADSSVNFICRPWTRTENYWDVYWDLTRRVKEAFDASGVSIPYPQLDVHSNTA